MPDLRPINNGSVDVENASVANAAFPIPQVALLTDVTLEASRSQSILILASGRVTTFPSAPVDGDKIYLKAMETSAIQLPNGQSIDGDDHAEKGVPQYGGYVFQWSAAITSWQVMASTGQALTNI
jgi:Na+-translocating ferredoxin:NAD+ oxidoreductase RnfG subunit